MSSKGNLGNASQVPARRSTRRSSSTSSLSATVATEPQTPKATLAEPGSSRRRSNSLARAGSGDTLSFKFANSAKTMAIIDDSANGHMPMFASIGFENIAILNISNLKLYNYEERLDYHIQFYPVLLTQGEIHYLKRCTNYEISQEDRRTLSVPVEDEEGDTRRYLVHLEGQWIDYQRLMCQYKGQNTEALIEACNQRITFSKAPFMLQEPPSLV